MESTVLMSSPVFYAILDLWIWISAVTWMCGKQSCQHHHWRYKVHWQLHHNSVVHLFFILAHNQRCQSLSFNVITSLTKNGFLTCTVFFHLQRKVPVVKTLLLDCPIVKGDEYSFLRLTFTFCQQIIWCWKTFRYLACYSFDTKLIFTLLERSNSVPSSDMETFSSLAAKGLVH
jgi:hypothetical protein